MPVLHLCIIRPLIGRTETFLLRCLISISFVHAKQQLMNASRFSLPLSRKGCVFQFQGEKPIIPKQLKRFVSEHKQTKAVRREHGKCFSLEQQFPHMPPSPWGPAVASAAVHPGANFRWWESTSWGWREQVPGSEGKATAPPGAPSLCPCQEVSGAGPDEEERGRKASPPSRAAGIPGCCPSSSNCPEGAGCRGGPQVSWRSRLMQAWSWWTEYP